MDGKITLVGIYQSKMIFPTFPAVIPKLAVIMAASTPITAPFQKLVFSLYKDEEQLQSFEIQPDVLKKAAEDAGSEKNSDARFIEFQFATVLSLINVESTCVFRTSLETETERLEGRSLEVTCLQPE